MVIINENLAAEPHIYHFPAIWKQVFKKRERLTHSQWADRYRYVVEGDRAGKWSNMTTPYVIGPLEFLSLPWVRAVYLCWAPQTAKTQVAMNFLESVIDQDPGPAMYTMPTESKTKDISDRLLRTFRATPRIAELMSTRKDDTKQKRITFKHGMKLFMVWASSVSELSSESIRYLIGDEVDKNDEVVGKEVDYYTLTDVRTNTYPYTKKKIYFSTPNDERGIVRLIETEADVKCHYEVCCPICGEYQEMIFDRIKWPSDIRDPRKVQRRKLANYECRACGMLWNDYMRNKAVQEGLKNPNAFHGWVMDQVVERPAAIGFHLPSWYSTFVSLSDTAAAFLRGKSDLVKFKAFITQHKAEAWKEDLNVNKDEDAILRARCDLPPQTVPDAAIALTCGVDVQKDGFWFATWAWARDILGLTGWLIHYGFLPMWSDVESLLYESAYPRQDGSADERIWRAAFDTGGGEKYDDMGMSEETYWWIVENVSRARSQGISIYGTKGASRPLPSLFKRGEPLLKTPSGKRLPDWFHIVLIDTSAMKDALHFGISQAATGGSGALYLHKETDSVFARHILAEKKKIDVKTKATEWVQKGANHLLDATILAMSLAKPQWIGGGVNILVPRAKPAKGKPPAAPAVAKSKWMTRE